MVKELREKYSLHLLLDIAGLKKSTYFYALEHLNYKEDKDKEIGDLIVKIFNDNHIKIKFNTVEGIQPLVQINGTSTPFELASKSWRKV